MENIIKKKFGKEFNFIIKPPSNNKIIALMIAGVVYIYYKKDN